MMEARQLSGTALARERLRRSWKGLAGFLAVALIVGAGCAVLRVKPYSELPLYLRAGTRMGHGEPIYRTTERAFTYPPLFALPFVPLAQLPQWTHRPVWYLVNLAALAVIVYCLNRRLRPGMLPVRGRAATPAWLFWSLVILLAGRHVLSPLENQSHDLLVFLCVMLAIDATCAMRERTAGFMAGLGAALKATPLLFVPLFLWQRRFTAVLVLGVTTVVFMHLPDVLFPAQDGVSWTVSWARTFLGSVQPGESAASTAWMPWNQLNQSLAGTFYRLFTPLSQPEPDQFDVCLLPLHPLALKGITLAAQLAVMGWLLWITRPRWTRDLPEGEWTFRKLGEGAALVTAMVLLSPTSIKTHFCVLLLPVAFCLADFLYRKRDRFVGAVLVLVFVLGTLTVKGLVGHQRGDLLMTHGTVTACGVALLLATGRVLMKRSHADLLTESRSEA